MKKFTRNFLLGEHSIVWFLRKVGLGLALVLWTTLAFAQEAQDTYHLKVASWDSCYQIDNVYSVPVTMKDFMKIMKFDLVLNYTNVADFDFIGLTQVNPAISTMTVQQLTDGNLTFAWSSTTPVSILPDNSDNLMFVLNFKIAGFQHLYLTANKFLFGSVLTWKTVSLFNDAGQCEILTDQITNGAISVTEKWPSVIVDSGLAACDGTDILATVTTPAKEAGMMYSFNGHTYQSTNSANVYAPTQGNTVIIKDANCISYVKAFDVKAAAPVTFDVESPVYTNCSQGNGDIEIVAAGGTTAYTYFIVPDADWVSHVRSGICGSGCPTCVDALLADYDSPVGIFEKPVGIYHVAVQDANGCADLTDCEFWQTVEVLDTITPFELVATDDMDLVTTCYNQPDGRISFVITGGTPWITGYNVAVNGMYIKKMFSYDSNVNVLCGGLPCDHAVLEVGCYNFVITDSLGCRYDATYCITEPDMIVFDVDHTDAGCGQEVGELWIASVDPLTGSGSTASWTWHYTTDPTWATNVSPWYSLSTKITNLPAGVYYVEIKDGNNCTQEWTNEAGDNAIKILTTEFGIVYTPIKCASDLTSVKIVLISGDANHTFEYMMEKEVCESEGEVTTCTWEVVGSGWQSGNIFTGILGDVNYRYSVKDVTAQGCVVSWEQIIPNPPVLNAEVLTYNTRMPSCPGNIDGNISVRAWGGTPGPHNSYTFQIDNRIPTTGLTTNDFVVGAGLHNIKVTDAAGCITSVTVNIPDGEDFINFVDRIYVDCAGDSVNLFNAVGWTSTITGEEVEWYHQVGLDNGYLLEYLWYPTINHTTDNDQGWLYEYWTSGGDWVQVPIQGNFESRNPKLYIAKSWDGVNKSTIVANTIKGKPVGHTSTFPAGTYYVVAKDEWGCYSNVDTIRIIEPLPLSVQLTPSDATCFNTWTGEIKVEAKHGRFIIPNSNGARYQYVLVQQPEIFNHPNWYGTQVVWNKFQHKNDALNDSTLTLAVQKGTYWVAIRDYCGIHDPSQIIILNEIVIGGKDAITAKVTVNDALCQGEKNGSIVVTNAAGGYDDFTYQLALVQGSYWPSNTTWPVSNKTGIFNDLYAGTYTVTVKDSKCDPYIETVIVKEPGKLVLSLTGVDASCFGSQDGIIRYTISGGTPPFKESTNNGANWYAIAEKTLTFDRRAGAGTYIVWLLDAHNCLSKDTLVLLQPGKLAINSTVVTNVSCPTTQAVNCKIGNVISDGAIKVYFSGGWNALDAAGDVFSYTVTATKGTDVRTVYMDITSPTTFANFDNLTAGEWTIKVWEHSWKTILFDKPYIMDPDYATKYASGFPATRLDWRLNPQQNPDISVCFATVKVTVGAPNPITYDVEYLPVDCIDTWTGEVHVHNVAGGTGPYWFALEGPADYTASLPAPYNTNHELLWKPAGTGVMEYLFTGLPWGHYNVFIKDSRGCVVCLESGEVNNQKALTLLVSWIKDADCYDTATGQIKLTATSYPDGYTLQYAVELASVVDQYLFPFADEDFITNLKWQDSNIFDVKSGVWIGYVKATAPDGLGICYAGHSTDANGNRIMNHRVFVDQPSQVQGAVWDKFAVRTLCYGDKNGKIYVSDVFGGNAGAYSAHVFGTTFDGRAVSEWFSDVKKGSYLDKLYASTAKTALIPGTLIADTSKLVASDYYTVVFLDQNGCLSPEYKVAVIQPEKFEIELVLKQDAFICPEDLAGVFEIRVISGGTGLITYRYEAWDGTTQKLSSPWGVINTFQGPAGLLYKGFARDANGCEDNAELFVAKPVKATFDVLDRTCFSDQKATAVVKMLVKDPTRTYFVRYWKYPDSSYGPWSVAFADSIKLTGLSYGDQSTDLGHYRFQIKDNMGCESEAKDITFVPVQTELKTCCAIVEPGECTGTLSITITGGITPYTVLIDGEPVTGASWVLAAGTHKILVIDKHLCTSEMDVTIEAHPVSRTAAALAFVGEKVQFTDAEAKLDTMLEKGVHTIMYMFNGCERTLVVTVTEQYRTATIAEIQGTGDVSPLKDLPRQTTGTVTAVLPGVGYFIQDARDSINGRCGIFVSDIVTTVLENTGVKVGGTVDEVNGVTTLIAEVVEIVPGTAYKPIVLDSPADAEQEKWESVLVTVVGARFQGTANPDGSWVIKTTETNNVVVDDWMYPYSPNDGDYYTVTGIVNGAHDLYKLEPRKAADVIDLTKTTPVLDIDNLQFKVYPNPFKDYLNIDNSNKLTRVTVTNIAGQRVMDIQYPERVIRTTNLVSGVYVVTLFTDEGIAKSERIVKR